MRRDDPLNFGQPQKKVNLVTERPEIAPIPSSGDCRFFALVSFTLAEKRARSIAGSLPSRHCLYRLQHFFYSLM